MSKTSASEGTKIAQAAKELNVTSVTIRRYLSEFNIETTSDENGVKVLPPDAMGELLLIRQLKEDGLTNPKVLEELEQRRAKPAQPKSRTRTKPGSKSASRLPESEAEAEEELEAGEAQSKRSARSAAGHRTARKAEDETAETPSEEEIQPTEADLSPAGRSKHSLTCQTCGKTFEHMNPRLRDCLDCYRTKRKERRRGGSDKHKNVIQHPLAQQAATKTAPPAELKETPVAQPSVAVVSRPQSSVRNYRKAIEDTRHTTSNLKRRLERPDLSEGERRWLEQIYAYQLILHQGWRHLAEYKAGSKEQAKSD